MIVAVDSSTTRSGVIPALVDHLGLMRGVECSVLENRLQATVLIIEDAVGDLMRALADLMAQGDVVRFQVWRPWPQHIRALRRSHPDNDELKQFVLNAFQLLGMVCVVDDTTGAVRVLRPANDQEQELYRRQGPGTVIRRQPRVERVVILGSDVPPESIEIDAIEQFPTGR